MVVKSINGWKEGILTNHPNTTSGFYLQYDDLQLRKSLEHGCLLMVRGDMI